LGETSFEKRGQRNTGRPEAAGGPEVVVRVVRMIRKEKHHVFRVPARGRQPQGSCKTSRGKGGGELDGRLKEPRGS